MASQSSPEVTQLLLQWGAGNKEVLARLIPLVHHDLVTIARRCMVHERKGHVLQPTALVNEVYVRLVDVSRIRSQDRAHFLALAARLMRNVLVEAARSQRFQKRGGVRQRVSLDECLMIVKPRSYDLLALDEAIQRLAAVDPRRGTVVELRFFGGLTVEETAEALEISPDTVGRDWKLAKAWLAREMRGQRRQ